MHEPSLDLIELKKLCVRMQSLLAPMSNLDADALYETAINAKWYASEIARFARLKIAEEEGQHEAMQRLTNIQQDLENNRG
jgi:hypothetical protein